MFSLLRVGCKPLNLLGGETFFRVSCTSTPSISLQATFRIFAGRNGNWKHYCTKVGLCESKFVQKSVKKIVQVPGFSRTFCAESSSAVNFSPQKTIQVLQQYLEEAKAQEVVVLDTKKGSRGEYDFMVVCHLKSERHLRNIAYDIQEKARQGDFGKNRIEFKAEGTESTQWIVIDLCGVLVHLFLEETRR
eukprot:Sdes_comp9830_c0_seq1m1369